MPKLYSVFKWLIFIASYLFLAYKLFTFNQYDELVIRWNHISIYQVAWLVGVFALLPLNWFLEAVKWKMLTAHVQQIGYNDAFKAVLVGISTGFFTPNRVGELVGRILYLQPHHRKAGVALSVLNSITQNLIMALCGIPASILFFSFTQQVPFFNLPFYVGMLLLGFLLLGLLFYFFPIINNSLKKTRFASSVTPYTDCVLEFKPNILLQIMGVSLLRYIVFCSQFWFLLQFFDIQLALWQAIIAIPATYLLVTFTPSMAFSEAAVRSAYAVLVIGVFAPNTVGIVLAGVGIWAVNFIIPMLVGSVIMIRTKL